MLIKYSNIVKCFFKNILFFVIPMIITLMISFYFYKNSQLKKIEVDTYNYKYEFVRNIEKTFSIKFNKIYSIDEFEKIVFSTIGNLDHNLPNLKSTSIIKNLKNIKFDTDQPFRLKELNKSLVNVIPPSAVLPIKNFTLLEIYNDYEVITVFNIDNYQIYISNLIFSKKNITDVMLKNIKKSLNEKYYEKVLINALIQSINKKHLQINQLNNEVNSTITNIKNFKKNVFPIIDLNKVYDSKLIKDLIFVDEKKNKFLKKNSFKIFYSKYYSNTFKTLFFGLFFSLVIFFLRVFYIVKKKKISA